MQHFIKTSKAGYRCYARHCWLCLDIKWFPDKPRHGPRGTKWAKKPKKKKVKKVRQRRPDPNAWLKEIAEQPCIRCGWNEGLSQRHRILPGKKGGEYEKGNVVPLCPNCHSLITRGVVNEYTA